MKKKETIFDENFPELVGKTDYGKLKCEDGSTAIADWVWLPMVDRHCLSKQRVREVITAYLDKYSCKKDDKIKRMREGILEELEL